MPVNLQVDNEGSRNVIRSERSAGKCGHGKDEKHFSQWLPPLQHRGGIRRREAALGGGILEESVYERDENAGEEDKERERTGGERGMASLQSGVLQRGRRTEGCTGEGKEPTQTVYCVKVEFAERKLREALEKADETLPDQKGKPTQK